MRARDGRVARAETITGYDGDDDEDENDRCLPACFWRAGISWTRIRVQKKPGNV